MEGVKCPRCKSLLFMQSLIDGEMEQCSNCETKFTITPDRRYFPDDRLKNGQPTDLLLEKLRNLIGRLEKRELLILSQMIQAEVRER